MTDSLTGSSNWPVLFMSRMTSADIVRDANVFLLSDEVYEHIVFDGARHQSLLMHDELWERSLVISSFGKTYHATGWKIGYCVAPAALTEEFTGRDGDQDFFHSVNAHERAKGEYTAFFRL